MMRVSRVVSTAVRPAHLILFAVIDNIWSQHDFLRASHPPQAVRLVSYWRPEAD
jgi:hypothetical protein